MFMEDKHRLQNPKFGLGRPVLTMPEVWQNNHIWEIPYTLAMFLLLPKSLFRGAIKKRILG